MNHTFLTLIPKVDGTSKVEQFRPIALYNVALKILTKIFVNRCRHILDKIVAPSQATFIPNRNITDNIVINHEIMHYMNTRKGPNPFWILKLIWPKHAMGLIDNFLKKLCSIMLFHLNLCIAFINVYLISRTQFWSMVHHLDISMHPEGLGKGSHAKDEGKIHKIKVAKTSPSILHPMYANNLVVYSRATLTKVEAVMKCLNLFCKWSGQDVNVNKSTFTSSVILPRIWRLEF